MWSLLTFNLVECHHTVMITAWLIYSSIISTLFTWPNGDNFPEVPFSELTVIQDIIKKTHCDFQLNEFLLKRLLYFLEKLLAGIFTTDWCVITNLKTKKQPNIIWLNHSPIFGYESVIFKNEIFHPNISIKHKLKTSLANKFITDMHII